MNTIQPRPDALVSTLSPQRAKTLENSESAIESKSENDQDNNSKVSQETIKFSDTSLKLSSNSPVKSTDEFAPIKDEDQARQVLNKLLSDFQSNPSQAQGAHNNVFSGAVKSLLG
jgi:hypothetical protein